MVLLVMSFKRSLGKVLLNITGSSRDSRKWENEWFLCSILLNGDLLALTLLSPSLLSYLSYVCFCVGSTYGLGRLDSYPLISRSPDTSRRRTLFS